MEQKTYKIYRLSDAVKLRDELVEQAQLQKAHAALLQVYPKSRITSTQIRAQTENRNPNGTIFDSGAKTHMTKAPHPRIWPQMLSNEPFSAPNTGLLSPHLGKNGALLPLPSPVAEKGD